MERAVHFETQVIKRGTMPENWLLPSHNTKLPQALNRLSETHRQLCFQIHLCEFPWQRSPETTYVHSYLSLLTLPLPKASRCSVQWRN